jgi:hypothetical protein
MIQIRLLKRRKRKEVKEDGQGKVSMFSGPWKVPLLGGP